jgi:hypothetical protein
LTEFSFTVALTVALSLVGTTVSLVVTPYVFRGSSSTIVSLGAGQVATPAFTGVVAIGTSASGSADGLNYPLLAGDTLVFVVSITSTGVSLVNVVTGSISINTTLQ